MKTGIIVVLIFLNVCISCTYQRPLLSIRISSKLIIDSVANHKIKEKDYRYISLRAHTVNAAGYFKAIEFDSLGNKIKVSKWKKYPLQPMNDGYARLCIKMVYYSSTGDIEKISKRIVQNRGVGGTSKNKTIYFKNGKRIKSMNE